MSSLSGVCSTWQSQLSFQIPSSYQEIGNPKPNHPHFQLPQILMGPQKWRRKEIHSFAFSGPLSAQKLFRAVLFPRKLEWTRPMNIGRDWKYLLLRTADGKNPP